MSSMVEIQQKLHQRFPYLPQNALKKIYKAHCERLRLLMINGIPADIRWLIKAKVRLAGEFSDPFISYMPGFGKSTFAKKRRAKRLGSECSNCVRLACKKPRCQTLGMVSVNREDKIKFVKDGMSKESLDDILRSLETHPSGYVQREIQNLWKLFQKESVQFSLGNMTLKDHNFSNGSNFKQTTKEHLCAFWISLWKYKEFVQAAIDLGRAIAERKLHLVYGRGNRGLSKLVSEAAFVRGSQVLGIIPKALKPLGYLPDSPTGEELVVLAKKLFICTPTANELLDLLQAYKPEPDPMTLPLDWATEDNGSNSRKKYKLDLTLGL
ncbi:hypothetical protein WN944_027020 [Citrus x changshan-huyou]|uniref:Uncharacterized protein n=1 Tax=Citrus x changshan-huyou TaxID=2935761 RepID=A0AAP0LH56_9ROSI